MESKEEPLLTWPLHSLWPVPFLTKLTGLLCHEARTKARLSEGQALSGRAWPWGFPRLPADQQHSLSVFNYRILIFISGLTQRSRGPSCVLRATMFEACWGKKEHNQSRIWVKLEFTVNAPFPSAAMRFCGPAPVRLIPKASSCFPPSPTFPHSLASSL